MGPARFGPWIPLLFAFLFPSTSPPPQATQTVTRDAQALAILQQAVSAMGTPPTDSLATGEVTVTAGSSTETGSIEILTRGVEQTLERRITPSATSEFVYSAGLASASDGQTRKGSSLEWAQTAQSTVFPLPLLAGGLQNPDIAFAYVGQDTVEGTLASHIQFWNTFASNPQRQALASLPRRDVWISTTTGLPLRISFTEQDGRGWTVPKTRIETTYEKYQAVSGVMYPLLIDETLNGSQWLTITITNVALNTGLSDSNFPLE